MTESYGSRDDVDVSKPSPVPQKPRGKLPLPAFGMLIVFTTINLLSYFDRGALSGALEDIAKNLDDLTEGQKGFLGSAFMGGYMLGSPVMAHLVHHVEPFFVFSAGLFLWVLATFLCGISTSYLPLLLGRTLTGFGEAGFLCIVPPLLDRIAPNTSKSLWLSVFYSAIPVGYAIGFALSGIILDTKWWGENTWRMVFIIEALIMVPFVIFGMFGRSPYSFSVKHHEDDEIEQGSDVNNLGYPSEGNGKGSSYYPPTMETAEGILTDNGVQQYRSQARSIILHDDMPFYKTNPFLKRLYALFMNPLYVTLVLGYSAQTFTTGGFAFYGISYVKHQFNASRSAAGMIFGGVTILSGIVGTLLGGVILDRWRKQDEIPSSMAAPISVDEQLATDRSFQYMSDEEKEDYKMKLELEKNDLHNPNMIKDRLQSIELAYRLVVLATAISIPFALLCFLVNNIWLFAFLIFCCEFTLFTCLSVLNSAVIWSVPFNLSPQAIAFSVVVVHLLGDSLSPFFIGILLDATNRSYRSVMIICCAPLAIAVLFWSIGSGKVLKMLNLVRFYQYTTTNTTPLPKETRQQQNNNEIPEQTPSALRPFAEIRQFMLWPVAESCH